MWRADRAYTLLANAVVKDVKYGGDAFADAAQGLESLLAALARRLCSNDADAEDLVHDTYERALRAWERNANHADLRSWMVSILNHLFIDRCRTARRRPHIEPLEGLELSAPEPTPPPAWSRISDQQLEAALAALDPGLRATYELRVRGYSYEQIAVELNIPKRTVGTRLFRARRRLKAALQRQKLPATITP